MPGSAEPAHARAKCAPVNPAAGRRAAMPASGAAQPSGLAQIDRALIGLRHLWSTPPQVHDPALGSIDMSTIWIVDALTQAEESGRRPAGTSARDSEAGYGGQVEMTIGDLGLALDVAHSTASRLVDRAQASGAVARAPSHTDARMVTVRLTDPGRELAATARGFRRQHLHRATTGWTDHERATFAELITRFADALNALDDKP